MLCPNPSAFSSGSPFLRPSYFAPWLAVAALALGCTPKIGDSCTVSTNCSATGDRLCDITQPGGYCTVFNCEPGTCPADSVCINFGTSLSAVPGCSPSQGNSPYQRSFCMANCGSDGDCRGGYVCLDLSGKLDVDGKPSNMLGAVLAESSGTGKVCTVRAPDGPTLETYDGGAQSNQVCRGAPPDTAGTPAAGGPVSAGGSGSAGSSSSAGSSDGGDAGSGG